MEIENALLHDKLSLEIIRSGLVPVENAEDTKGILFVNTNGVEPDPSIKLAIRPRSGSFELPILENQNPTAGIDVLTKYLHFCTKDVKPDSIDCTNATTVTNPVKFTGKFGIEINGQIISTGTEESILKTINENPNLVTIYDHTLTTGRWVQLLGLKQGLLLGNRNTFYVEIDGIFVNTDGESILEALSSYEKSTNLLIDPKIDFDLNELQTESSSEIHNLDNNDHTLYIRYIGTDSTILNGTNLNNPLFELDSEITSAELDPDGLGIYFKLTGCKYANIFMLPEKQTVMNGHVIGNRYVLNINGTEYRDTRTSSELPIGGSSLEDLIILHPNLSDIIDISVNSNRVNMVNKSVEILDVKIYLDKQAPYYSNNETVGNTNNPSGIYRKLKYPYGSTLTPNGIRETTTPYPSVAIKVTDEGISFKLGPNTGDDL